MDNQHIFSKTIQRVIDDQSIIIGPVAQSLANQVLENRSLADIDLLQKEDSEKVLCNLIQAYKGVFGDASVEVCKESLLSVSPHLEEATINQIIESVVHS